MTAVATPTQPRAKKTGTAKAAGHAIPTPSLTQAETQNAFGELAKILADAHQTDELHLWSGNSDRLLRVARDLAEEASKHPPSAADVDQLAFDIAALIVGAKLIPGDAESPERLALLQRAAVILNWLTEECGGADQDCCDPGVDRPVLRADLHQRVAPKLPAADGGIPASSSRKDTFASTAWYRASEAEAVLRTYAEDAGKEEDWAILTVVNAATAILSRTHENPSDSDYYTASCYLGQAIAIGSMVTESWPDLLLDAGLTILVLAKDILDNGERPNA